jgi:drug/metabolite transporter (DMT)-like permease
MLRIGVILIVLGFGSVGLSEFTDRQFAVLMWAEPMQTWLGATVGMVGAALAGFAFVQSRKKAKPAAQPEEAAQPAE